MSGDECRCLESLLQHERGSLPECVFFRDLKVGEDLQSWINKQTIGNDMLWKGAFGDQMQFIRDVLTGLLFAGHGLSREERNTKSAKVISTHRSKSIVLPVVEFERPDLGLRLTFRNNFHNWKFSVLSEDPVEVDFSKLFPVTPPTDPTYTGNPLAAVYFEGFPEDRIYGYYSENPSKFSGEIWSDYALWTAMFLLLDSKKAFRPHQWSTRGSVP